MSRMLETLLDHLVETYRVDKESSIDPIHLVFRDASDDERSAVDLVTDHWVLVSWFKNEPGYFEMFSIRKGFIQPQLDCFVVERLPRILHAHEVLHLRLLFMRTNSTYMNKRYR